MSIFASSLWIPNLLGSVMFKLAKASVRMSLFYSIVQSNGKTFDQIVHLAHHLSFGLAHQSSFSKPGWFLSVALDVFSVLGGLASRVVWVACSLFPFCFINACISPAVLSATCWAHCTPYWTSFFRAGICPSTSSVLGIAWGVLDSVNTLSFMVLYIS